MSTIIIVLLVIVLVVAIVLKKRADNENTATPKKGGAAKPQKKAASKKVATKSTPIAEVETQQQTNKVQANTPVPTQLKEKIEQLILANNFQAAEAQINQALKTDDSQHDLYILLLDLHIAQKDDFAINQLIKHLQDLELNSLIQTALDKKKEYETNKPSDALEFHSSKGHFGQTSTIIETPVQDNSADFDALVASPSPAESFDQLQTEVTPPPVEEPKIEAEPTPEVKPLDFSFSFEQKETAEPAIEIETKSSPEPELTESKDQASLEFSFNLEPTTSPTVTEQEVKVEETKSGLDFSFADLELKTPEPETKTEAPIHLDLDFNQPEVKLEEQPVFDKTAFTFEINEPTTAEETQPELITPVSQTAPALSTNDPLMQSFPDLQTMDEAQLNLDLAEQYIELGAYESARVILQTNQSLFNQDQQQYVEKLLNKIAS